MANQIIKVMRTTIVTTLKEIEKTLTIKIIKVSKLIIWIIEPSRNIPTRETDKRTINKSINQHSHIDYISDYQSDEELKKLNIQRPKYNYYKTDRTTKEKYEDNAQIPNNKVNDLEKSIQEIENKNEEIGRNLENLRMERSRLEDKSFAYINNNSTINNDLEKLRHENNTLKSDNIMFKEELNMMNELNRRLDADLNKQRMRK